MPPSQGIKRAEQVRGERSTGSGAAIPGRRSELAEHIAARMAYDISILELRQVIFMTDVRGPVPTGLRCGIGLAHGPGFDPGIFSGVAVA